MAEKPDKGREHYADEIESVFLSVGEKASPV
jgi:hypothetical protein